MIDDSPDRPWAYDPRGTVAAQPRAIAPRAAALAGLRLGVLDNSKWKAGDLLRRLAAALEGEDGVTPAGYWRKESFSKTAPEATIAEIAAASDVVLTAIGD